MRLLVVGTIPVNVGQVVRGVIDPAEDGSLSVNGVAIPLCQGTSAMVGAASAVCSHYGAPLPHVLLGGDIGHGEGTRAVFDALAEEIERVRPTVIAFHYLQPVMKLMKRAVDQLRDRSDIRLLADAGGMYAAKAAGVGRAFSMMTPDVGEVGFLADPAASHPAYVSQYLFGTEAFDPPRLGKLAWELGGAEVLLIKGRSDHILERGEVYATVSEPCVPELEAIGGTGDTVTGLAAGFLAAGLDTVQAAVGASQVNREAGVELQARPDHRASDLVRMFPRVLEARREGRTRPAMAPAASPA